MMALMEAVEDAGGTVVRAISAGTGMLGGSIKPDKGDIDKFLNKLDLTKDEFEELFGFETKPDSANDVLSLTNLTTLKNRLNLSCPDCGAYYKLVGLDHILMYTDFERIYVEAVT
jgi:hypothetical protein